MAPRLLGELPAVLASLAGRLNGVDDATVAGTPAEMAVERLRDRIAIAALAVLDEGRRAHHDPRNAEPALHATFEDECLPDDAPRLLGKTFERDDLVSLHLLGLAQARERRPAVDHHEAAAAGPFRRTAVLRGHDAALFAQHLEQVHPRLVGGFGGFSVQGELNLGHLETSIVPHA